jgi:hypothetical protein
MRARLPCGNLTAKSSARTDLRAVDPDQQMNGGTRMARQLRRSQKHPATAGGPRVSCGGVLARNNNDNTHKIGDSRTLKPPTAYSVPPDGEWKTPLPPRHRADCVSPSAQMRKQIRQQLACQTVCASVSAAKCPSALPPKWSNSRTRDRCAIARHLARKKGPATAGAPGVRSPGGVNSLAAPTMSRNHNSVPVAVFM